MNKNTGIVRRIDDLGRIVLPKELRRTLGIKEYDALEIWVNDENIILTKYLPRNMKTYDELVEENAKLRDELVILKGHQIV